MTNQELLESLQSDIRNVNASYQAHAQIEQVFNHYKKRITEPKEDKPKTNRNKS